MVFNVYKIMTLYVIFEMLREHSVKNNIGLLLFKKRENKCRTD